MVVEALHQVIIVAIMVAVVVVVVVVVEDVLVFQNDQNIEVWGYI